MPFKWLNLQALYKILLYDDNDDDDDNDNNCLFIYTKCSAFAKLLGTASHLSQTCYKREVKIQDFLIISIFFRWKLSIILISQVPANR